MTPCFYNDTDRFACDWLENLIAAGEIGRGPVDRRDVQEVQASDLAGYERVHLFAGIGGWELAARLAGWPRGLPFWSASFPCQPFSAAGSRKAEADERHLWPAGLALIEKCRPSIIVGEQVASALGRRWLARVRADLEALGYAVGAADLCSPGSGAPNIRQRLFWVAHAEGAGLPGREDARANRSTAGPRLRSGEPARDGETERLADTEEGRRGPGRNGGAGNGPAPEPSGQRRVGWLGDADSRGQRAEHPPGEGGHPDQPDGAGRVADTDRTEFRGEPHAGQQPLDERDRGPGFWDPYDLIPCQDHRFRRVEPGTFPLAPRLPRSVGPGSTKGERVDLVAAKAHRVGRLRGYGNAINPQVAATFMTAALEAMED